MRYDKGDRAAEHALPGIDATVGHETQVKASATKQSATHELGVAQDALVEIGRGAACKRPGQPLEVELAAAVTTVGLAVLLPLRRLQSSRMSTTPFSAQRIVNAETPAGRIVPTESSIDWNSIRRHSDPANRSLSVAQPAGKAQTKPAAMPWRKQPAVFDAE